MSETNQNQNQNAVTTALVMYDKITDPVQAVEQLGGMFARSGMFGCEKVEQGMVLALACISERKSPFELLRTYYIIKNQLSMRADAMLAKFNEAGGKHFWVTTTKETATIRVTYGQFKDYEVSYTLADAEQAELCGKGGAMRPGQKGPGQWQKVPDAVLRARCVSKCIRMVAPGIVAGTYTPEDLDTPQVDAPKAAQTTYPRHFHDLFRRIAFNRCGASMNVWPAVLHWGRKRAKTSITSDSLRLRLRSAGVPPALCCESTPIPVALEAI